MSVNDMQPAPCPEEDVLRAYAARTLSDEDAERFEEHYFGCDRCWSHLQRALELRGALAEEASAVDRVVRGPWAGWRTLAAAAVLAAVAVGLWTLMPGRGPTMRGDTVELAPVVASVEGGFEARWSEVAEADVYRVEVFSDAGELLLSRETQALRLLVKKDALPSSMTDRPLFLKVRALDDLRRPLASSALVPVTTGTDGPVAGP